MAAGKRSMLTVDGACVPLPPSPQLSQARWCQRGLSSSVWVRIVMFSPSHNHYIKCAMMRASSKTDYHSLSNSSLFSEELTTTTAANSTAVILLPGRPTFHSISFVFAVPPSTYIFISPKGDFFFILFSQSIASCVSETLKPDPERL